MKVIGQHDSRTDTGGPVPSRIKNLALCAETFQDECLLSRIVQVIARGGRIEIETADNVCETTFNGPDCEWEDDDGC